VREGYYAQKCLRVGRTDCRLLLLLLLVAAANWTTPVWSDAGLLAAASLSSHSLGSSVDACMQIARAYVCRCFCAVRFVCARFVVVLRLSRRHCRSLQLKAPRTTESTDAGCRLHAGPGQDGGRRRTICCDQVSTTWNFASLERRSSSTSRQNVNVESCQRLPRNSLRVYVRERVSAALLSGAGRGRVLAAD